jgi:hypothetical protein
MQLRQSIADQLKTQPMLAPVEDMLSDFIFELLSRYNGMLQYLRINKINEAMEQLERVIPLFNQENNTGHSALSAKDVHRGLEIVDEQITAQFLLQLNAKMRLVLKDISRNNMDRALKQYYGLHLMVADVIQ